LKPREEFREFNAEATGSAPFLASLTNETGDRTHLNAATRAMAFVERDVLPRENWSDFETFCHARESHLASVIIWTAQYPQKTTFPPFRQQRLIWSYFI
jgi:hypothetical protein